MYALYKNLYDEINTLNKELKLREELIKAQKDLIEFYQTWQLVMAIFTYIIGLIIGSKIN